MNLNFRILWMVAPLFAFGTELEIEPSDALVDEPISIRVEGVPPHGEVIIRSETEDASGAIWTAEAVYIADGTGKVSVAEMAPVRGSYEGVDPMGLIWSMKSSSPPLFRNSKEPLPIAFTLEIDGQQVCKKEILRRKTASNVQRLDVRDDGLVATLFLPESEKPLPAVIVLGGSGGGLSESRSQVLASRGFAVLSLAYFGEKGLPKSLKRIPLEYFETALDWLKRHPAIEGNKIGILGVSRGAELGLILGSLFPEKIQAIAAIVPSSVVYGSFEPGGDPAWLYSGERIKPNAPFPDAVFSEGEGTAPEKAILLTPYFLRGMEDSAAFKASQISVEKIQCPILLISGQDDQMWPSDLFAKQIRERLTVSSVHLSYPGAGHYISPPCFPTTGRLDFHPIAKLWFDFGGNPKDDALARADSWKKTLEFFHSTLD